MIEITFLLMLLIAGYGFGRYAEKSHYRSIIEREQQLSGIPAVKSKIPPADQNFQSQLVTGNVVISVDYFKRFIAGLRNLVGGSMNAYESLLDRARREAILRMKKEAEMLGAEYVFNVKMETSIISINAKGNVGSIEMLAYGTALIR